MVPIVRQRSIALRAGRAVLYAGRAALRASRALRAGRAALCAGFTALLLIGCQHAMTASFGGGASSSAAPADAPATPNAAPAGTAAAETEAAPERWREPGSGPTGDTAVLVGATVEEATRLAREKGYAGKVEVLTLSEFQAGCKPATVCGVSPRLWELLPGRLLTLYVNRELKIATPN